MTQYLTIDIEGIESFNDKCNQLSKQGWVPTTPVSSKLVKKDESCTYTRYIQQWSITTSIVKDEPDNISTEAL